MALGTKAPESLTAEVLLPALPDPMEYLTLCQHPSQHSAPCWFQVASFPLQLYLLTQRRFPLAAIGLVHLMNRIDVLAPPDPLSPVRMVVHSGLPEPHAKGQLVWLETACYQHGQLVWRSRASYLQRQHKSKPKMDRQPSTEPGIVLSLPRQSTLWTLPVSLGWRYGRLSGDLNPIHLHPLLARLFGFKANIAHGMWSKARCLAELAAQGALPELPYQVEVRFDKPILLPATVQCHWQSKKDGCNFALLSADGALCHLQGTIMPIRNDC
ncbi:MaoC like domain-containing protein [Alkalimonas amylolytica]|uniref:MaoC like domain-containing protein n=2 Tax=Alkalimonas amylolytica TaxID=152573 RepID=A0A1H4FK33_ALKAM|nr:MaoC like domain-containing protein [Alkalimonas amylolytica]